MVMTLPSRAKRLVSEILDFTDPSGREDGAPAGKQDVYVGWYDEDKAEIFVSLWKKSAGEEVWDKAQDSVDSAYGDKGTMMLFDPKTKVIDAKKKVAAAVKALADKAGVDAKWRGGQGESKLTEKHFTDEQIVDELVGEFGDEFREEITDSLDSGNGTFKADGAEYRFYSTEKEAEDQALVQVTDTLESEPELFNQDFIKEHLFITDTDKRVIAGEEADAAMDGRDDEEFLKEAGTQDEYDAAVEAEEDKKAEKILDDAKEEFRSNYYDQVYDKLDKDPIGYFVDDLGAYSVEDLMKQSFISIDIKKAAQEAVDTDGWAHFLSNYSGEYQETKGGIVYFRES